MAVSAVDSAESLASFSTFGSNIDVAAPGVDILSTWTEDGGRSGSISGKYAKISGTSMACPATSGVAALGKAANPSWGPSELRQQLKNTAVDIGLAQNKQGAGRVDAQKLIGGTESDDQKPTPSFTVDITDPHVEETVVLESTASDAKGFIDAYEWEFSDGTTKSGKNVKHTFSTTGDKTITHTVTDDEGETASSTKTVTVQAGGPGEKQNSETFSGTISQGGGRSENTYNFQFDPSSLEVTIDTSVDFAWGLSHNGEVYTPSSGSDTVTVQDFNLYPDKAVTLIVVSTEQAGNPTGSYTLNLTEYGFGDGGTENQAPTADFSVDDATVETNTQVTFDASAASDPDGTIETYSWDFGDSTQKTGEVVTHSYASAGDYSATLTVTDDGGKRDQASTTIQVSDPTSQDPTAAFTLSSSTITAGDSVTADPSGSSDDGTITSYEWAWGDGSSETTGSATSVSHTYDSSGSYDIILTVTDDDGNSSSTSRTLTVEQASDGGENVTEETSSLSGYWDSTAYTVTTTLDSPDSMTFELVGPSSADFDLYVTTDGRTPSAYDYDERSASYGSQETVEITSGVTSSSEFGVLVDSYDGSGDYTLTITETGSGGGGGGDPNEGPTAAATADPTEAETGTTITFDASGSSDSDGSISSYEWSLGDGTSKSGATVQHSYDSADTYNASVTVTDDDGATDSASVAVTINEPSGGGGSEEVTEVTGSLSGYWDEDQWDYTPQTSSPSQLTIELDGPSSADFDLYASLNEDPSTWDNDKESESLGSQEQIVLENFDASDEVNVMVTPYEGSGSYTLTLTETSN
jgi:PKD repeat protein